MRSLRKGTSPELLAEFREFVVGTQGHLRRSAYVMCGDWHLAEDLVQEAYDRVFRAWPRVRGMDRPDAYIRQVVLATNPAIGSVVAEVDALIGASS